MKTPDGEWKVNFRDRNVVVEFRFERAQFIKGNGCHVRVRTVSGLVRMSLDGRIVFNTIKHAPSIPKIVREEASVLLALMVSAGHADKELIHGIGDNVL